jgi:hypothetical protein
LLFWFFFKWQKKDKIWLSNKKCGKDDFPQKQKTCTLLQKKFLSVVRRLTIGPTSRCRAKKPARDSNPESPDVLQELLITSVVHMFIKPSNMARVISGFFIGNFFAPGGQDFEFRPKAGLQAIAALIHFSNFFLYNGVCNGKRISAQLGNFFAPGGQEPELKFMILTWEGMFVACYRMK